MEFLVKYFALFHLFGVIGSFGWFWMENHHQNTHLMLEFFKGSFLVLNFSYYKLMTFLMLLYVILLSTLNVVRHLIFGNN